LRTPRLVFMPRALTNFCTWPACEHHTVVDSTREHQSPLAGIELQEGRRSATLLSFAAILEWIEKNDPRRAIPANKHGGSCLGVHRQPAQDAALQVGISRLYYSFTALAWCDHGGTSRSRGDGGLHEKEPDRGQAGSAWLGFGPRQQMFPGGLKAVGAGSVGAAPLLGAGAGHRCVRL